jgi:uncharacterized repeat protein (TIGR01451 family)
VNVGQNLTYTVTVTNLSDLDAQNVVVSDTLPAHVTLISATPGQGSCTGTTCNLGTIPAHGAVIIEYVVTVDQGAPAVLTNMACAATSTPDSNMNNNCDDEDTNVPGGSPTPTALPVSATPKVLPVTGGIPGAGGEDGRLVLGLGAGLLLTGLLAAVIARRRRQTSPQ